MPLPRVTTCTGRGHIVAASRTACYVLLIFVDVFDKLTDKITQFISNIFLSYSILSLLCKYHNNNPNDCQDFANLLLGYFNLGYCC